MCSITNSQNTLLFIQYVYTPEHNNTHFKKIILKNADFVITHDAES